VVYAVESGDTLDGIARKYGVTVKAIAELNELEDPSFIRVGQKLTIPVRLAEETPTPSPTKGTGNTS
jgi:LysM repeat protein